MNNQIGIRMFVAKKKNFFQKWHKKKYLGSKTNGYKEIKLTCSEHPYKIESNLYHDFQLFVNIWF